MALNRIIDTLRRQSGDAGKSARSSNVDAVGAISKALQDIERLKGSCPLLLVYRDDNAEPRVEIRKGGSQWLLSIWYPLTGDLHIGKLRLRVGSLEEALRDTERRRTDDSRRGSEETRSLDAGAGLPAGIKRAEHLEEL